MLYPGGDTPPVRAFLMERWFYMKHRLYPLGSLVLLLGIWQLAVTLLHTPAFILPSPVAVAQALVTDGQGLLQNSWVTLYESLIGLGIACLLAFCTALVMDRWQLLYQSFYPLLVISQTLPVMVLGPLLSLWFGFGMAPKIILVVLMSYFPIIVAFSEALGKVSVDQIRFLQTMGAKSWQVYRLLKIPRGMQGFFAGLRIAATYCVSGAIIGEWLSAEAGLGYYMIRVKNGYQIDKVFAAILCVIVLSLGLNIVTRGFQKLYYKIVIQGRLS